MIERWYELGKSRDSASVSFWVIKTTSTANQC
jgi:hypothetical protein